VLLRKYFSRNCMDSPAFDESGEVHHRIDVVLLKNEIQRGPVSGVRNELALRQQEQLSCCRARDCRRR